jgi:hypothetical protein
MENGLYLGPNVRVASSTYVDHANTLKVSAESDKPYLVASPAGPVLVWRTQNEGIRAVRTGKGSS